MKKVVPYWISIVFLSCLTKATAVHPSAETDPLPPGSYRVACSNVAQDFTRVLSDEDRTVYWEGRENRYVNELLTEPSAFRFNVSVPDERSLYSGFAGTIVPYVAIVCYPTSSTNNRPHYPINAAGSLTVPHMQRGTESPIWPEETTRFPILLYSHGLVGSPLGNEYLATVTLFASYGYVVIAPFHGDARFADVRIDGLSDLLRVFFGGGFNQMVELQAIRPHSLQAALDSLLTHADFRDRVDANKIGGFGASLGGQSLLLFSGAELTTAPFPLRSTRVMHDARLKAIAGYVPYFGLPFLPAFGDAQRGLDGVTVPVLAIAGTMDTTAPILLTAQGINRLVGTRFLVAFDGLPHTLRDEDVPDIFTWATTFLNAYAKDDRLERVKIARLERVRSGANDISLIDYSAPTSAIGDERIIIEYYNIDLNHYFLSSEEDEHAFIARGEAGLGWRTTGFAFKGWRNGSAQGFPVCRFYGKPVGGPNSHYFAVDPAICAWLQNDRSWSLENYPFHIERPVQGTCPADSLPVYIAYNNGYPRMDPNHRYSTSRHTIRELMSRGWALEGIIFCALP